MSFETVVAGNVITAAWGNMVRDQLVSPFADTATRTATVASPVEGMLAFMENTDRFYYYDGSDWKVLIYQRTTKLAGADTDITFNSVPSDLRHLAVIVHARGDTAAAAVDVRCQIGGDTSNSYQYTVPFIQNGVYSVTSPAAQGASALIGYIPAASTANVFGSCQIKWTGWNNTDSFCMTYSGVGGYTFSNTNHLMSQPVGYYAGASARTSVKVFPSAGNFVADSQVTILGDVQE